MQNWKEVKICSKQSHRYCIVYVNYHMVWNHIFARVCRHETTPDSMVFFGTTESNLTNKKSEDFPVLKDFHARMCHVRLKREACSGCCRRVKTNSVTKTKLPAYLPSWVNIKYLHFYICIYSVTVVTTQSGENYKYYREVNFCSCWGN